MKRNLDLQSYATTSILLRSLRYIKERRLQNPMWRATADLVDFLAFLSLLWLFVQCQWRRTGESVLSSSFVSFARCVNLWVVHNFPDSKLVFLPFLIDYICCFTVQKAIP